MLRGALSGVQHSGARAAGARVESAHLSADELNAYAENALPDAARARYMTHIVDCDDCRRIVASVALAAGPQIARELQTNLVSEVQTVVSAPAPVSWLAALFSPRMLRFALPVLAVAIVGTLVLVVMQNRDARKEATQVAQQSPVDQQKQTSVVESPPEFQSNTSSAASANSSTATANQSPDTLRTATGIDTQSSQSRNPPQETDTATPPPPPPSGKSVATTVEAPVTELADATTKEKKTESARPVVNMAPPAPASVAAQRADEREAVRAAEAGRSQAEANEAPKIRSDEEPAPSRRAEPRSGPSRDMSGIVARRNRSRADDNASGEFSVRSGSTGSSASTETRSVAGRKFYRRNDAWVDANYRDSMATATYRRGSEGFRALVADVPEIGRIAEQLPGTIVVVARGRAYRIN